MAPPSQAIAFSRLEGLRTGPRGSGDSSFNPFAYCYRTLDEDDLKRIREENGRVARRIRMSAGTTPRHVFGGGNPKPENWARSQAIPPTRVHHAAMRYPGESYDDEDEDLDRVLHPEDRDWGHESDSDGPPMPKERPAMRAEISPTQDPLKDAYVKRLEAEVVRLRRRARESPEQRVSSAPARRSTKAERMLAVEDDGLIERLAELQREHRQNIAEIERLQHETGVQVRQSAQSRWAAPRGESDKELQRKHIRAASSRNGSNDAIEEAGVGTNATESPRFYARAVRRTELRGSAHLDGISDDADVEGVTLEARQHARPKPRSWQMLETEIEKKKAEDEAELRVKIKARPIPSSTLVPRYAQPVMVRDAEARSEARKLERREKLIDDIVPFEGMEARAKEQQRKRHERERQRERSAAVERRQGQKRREAARARASASTVGGETYEQRVQREERQRKERIVSRSMELLSTSKLPERMEMWEQTVGKQKRAMRAEVEMNGGLTEEHTFNPKINTSVPDFDRLRQSFDASLRKARRSHTATAADVSNLTMFSEAATELRERKAQQKAEEELMQNLAKEADEIKERQRRRRLRDAAKNGTGAAVPMTFTQELRLSLTEERRIADQLMEVQAQERKAAKLERERRARREISQAVKESEAERQACYPGYLSLAEAEKIARRKNKEGREEWAQRKRELEERMSRPRGDRPMLLQQNAEHIAKERARRDALARVAQTVARNHQDDFEGVLRAKGQFRAFQKSGGLDGILDDDEQAAIQDKLDDDAFDE